MGGICEVGFDVASSDMIDIPSFMTIISGIQVILRLSSQQLEAHSVGITDGKHA
jgi:hypothetical protein